MERMGTSETQAEKTWIERYWPDILITFALVLVITFMFPRGKSYQFADLKEGRVYIGPEIIAPFTFSVNKSEEEYAEDVRKARESVARVFRKYHEISEKQLSELNSFLDQLTALLQKRDTTSEELQDLFRQAGIVLSDEDITYLLTGFQESTKTPATKRELTDNLLKQRVAEIKRISRIITTFVKELYSAGILDVEKEKFPSSMTKIVVREDGQEMLEDIRFYQGPNEARNTLLEKLRTDSDLDERKIKVGYQIAVHFLVPDVLFDKEETDARIEDAIANVPLAKDQVLAGERIIESHERITKQHIDKLNSLAIAKAERGETSGFWSRLAPNIGKFFTTIFIFIILAIFLWRKDKQILENRKQLLLIELVIFLIAIFTFFVNMLNLSAYLIPVAIAAMIVTIFFDSIVGFLITVAASLLVGTMRGNEFSITFVSIFVGSIAIITVSKVRTRNWVLHSIAAVAGAYILAIMVHDFLSYVSWQDMMKDIGFGVINGFLAPITTYVLIIVFEFAFDMTTDMTLLELSDLNQPLLRKLAMEAPGSYHHSIIVGNLAEAAAEAIGANALLARVGAYYHDIGKMEKPEYFVENQTKGRNPQEKLSPSMSSLVLLNHVRRGAEMARQYGLPKEIEDFIYQHHGTSLMSYFYQKALEQSDGQAVAETEYRYPGPKPKTRETAIVMLADAVEAASRTLKDPTPSRIKGLVEHLIDERFKSGELDDTPLTLQELSKISEAFQKILNGIFHGRIEYPSVNEEEKPEKTEKPEKQNEQKQSSEKLPDKHRNNSE